ncbi:MAG: DUF1549 domain-containing protein, partial [Verrucomicrobiales bacterium]
MKFLLSFLLSLLSATPLPAALDFNDDIQPILSEYCYQCHGPDSSTRKPEKNPLRLDRQEEAFMPRPDGEPVIIKGDAANSLFYQVLVTDKKSLRMPPAEAHKELKAEHIALFKQWIDEGAPYEDHWAFLPPVRPPLPAAPPEKAWQENPIDRFTRALMATRGFQPNPPADPRRFYRRLHFDLTGLPPAPEDVARFSWEHLEAEIDRLLATDAAAEQRARRWLDVARYADTHGIHIDNYRAIWPYRDWVIRAFKANQPFDQFITEQIAGDLLPEASLDQKIATGFHRCLPTTGEGGAIAEEYEAIYALDRTATTAAAFLGLTMECAACHDHKFDPVSMEDVYAFNAFFRNTTMHAMDRNKADHPPNIFVPLAQDRPRHLELTQEIAKVQKALSQREKSARADFAGWLSDQQSPQSEQAPAIDSTLALHLPLVQAGDELTGLIEGKESRWKSPFKTTQAPLGPAPLISSATLDLGDHAAFTRSDQISYGGFIRIEGNPTGAVIARMNPKKDFRGWDLWLQNGQPGAHLIDSWPKAANKIVAQQKLTPGTWHHLMITFDGRQSGHQSTALYLDGQRVPAQLDPNTIGGNIVAQVPLRLGSRHGNDSKLRGGSVALQDFRFYRRLLSPADIKALSENQQLQDLLALPAAQRSPAQEQILYRHYLQNADTAYRAHSARLDTLRQEQSAIENRGSLTLIMQEKQDSEPSAHILKRGDYTQKGERVTANTPAFLPPLPADAPRNRLGLARWLTAPENPLTARVTMNRLWSYLFGTGLVETTGDFGVMGARPSHPALLDWLAVEFIESGWDYRHMIKLITSSQTYRQSQQAHSQKWQQDPANRFLARGPRYRLDAEEIRDLALASSGLLVPQVGGPSVKPYQPKGIWNAVAMPQSNTRNYQAGSGDELYRRSLY